MTSQINANQELFLDILTKEEKEALLSKKMEEIRKKNEALRKRHEEIEADKRGFDALQTNNKKVSSPVKETKMPPGEPRIEAPVDGNKKDRPKQPKPARGGKSPTKAGRDAPNAQRPLSREYDDKDTYQSNREDRQQHRNSREFGPNDGYFRQSSQEGAYSGQRRPHNDRQQQHGYQNRQNNRPRSQDFDFRQNSRENDNERPQRPHSRHFDHRQISRESDQDKYSRQNSKEKRVQFEGSEFEPQAKRQQGGGRSPRKENKGYDFSASANGPPPDPAYNFLSDKYRETYRDAEKKDMSRRHPKNYGGEDFNNVQRKMKKEKERHDRGRGGGPPRNKMEMSVSMTGRERRQYVEWKAEREKVDQARIDRQKSSSGEWRREWDLQKDEKDFDERQSPQRAEPGKRPAGRIGSGRFDRGERDERQIAGPGRPEKAADGNRGHAVQDRKDKQPAEKEGNIPRPVGRGRGRGRGRGGGSQEVGRVRTSSGDDRKVECKRDLLVIKVDNSPGKPSDGSVEVEYSDGETSTTNPQKKPAFGSGGHTEELWWDEEADEMAMNLGLAADDDIFEPKDLFDDQEEEGEGLEYDNGGHIGEVSQGDTDEWEDCTTSEDVASTDRSQASVNDYENDPNSPLKVNCHLNPDAPVFTPTSPVSPLSPLSPSARKSPVSKDKVVNWNQADPTKSNNASSKGKDSDSVADSKLNDQNSAELKTHSSQSSNEADRENVGKKDEHNEKDDAAQKCTSSDGGVESKEKPDEKSETVNSGSKTDAPTDKNVTTGQLETSDNEGQDSDEFEDANENEVDVKPQNELDQTETVDQGSVKKDEVQDTETDSVSSEKRSEDGLHVNNIDSAVGELKPSEDSQEKLGEKEGPDRAQDNSTKAELKEDMSNEVEESKLEAIPSEKEEPPLSLDSSDVPAQEKSQDEENANKSPETVQEKEGLVDV